MKRKIEYFLGMLLSLVLVSIEALFFGETLMDLANILLVGIISLAIFLESLFGYLESIRPPEKTSKTETKEQKQPEIHDLILEFNVGSVERDDKKSSQANVSREITL